MTKAYQCDICTAFFTEIFNDIDVTKVNAKERKTNTFNIYLEYFKYFNHPLGENKQNAIDVCPKCVVDLLSKATKQVKKDAGISDE